MKGLRKKSIDMLCGFGKFGLGKSITLGMYDFEVPAKLMSGGSQDDNSVDKKNNKNRQMQASIVFNKSKKL